MKKKVFLTALLIILSASPVLSQSSDGPKSSGESPRKRMSLPDVESILDKLDFGIIKKVDLREKTVYIRDNFDIKWGVPPGLINQAQPFLNYNPYIRVSLAGRSGRDSSIIRRSSFIRPMGNIKISRQFPGVSLDGGFRLDYVRVSQFARNGSDLLESKQRKVIIPALFVNVGFKF